MKVNASDYLANERTFLAYLRTAVAAIGFGFVIARFSVLLHEAVAVTHGPYHSSAISTPLGVAMVAAGVLIGAWGAARYVTVARALAAGESGALSPRSAVLVAAVLGVLGVVVAYILLVAGS
jgi:putative membrane protein